VWREREGQGASGEQDRRCVVGRQVLDPRAFRIRVRYLDSASDGEEWRCCCYYIRNVYFVRAGVGWMGVDMWGRWDVPLVFAHDMFAILEETKCLLQSG